jgi:hypothetical protein
MVVNGHDMRGRSERLRIVEDWPTDWQGNRSVSEKGNNFELCPRKD